MVTIYMNGQNRTNQMSDWRIWCKEETQTLMLTIYFPSGKSWSQPMKECQIEPCQEFNSNFLLSKDNYHSEIEYAVEYGNKFVVVKYPSSEKRYVMESKNVSFSPKPDLKKEDLFKYFSEIASERVFNADNDKKAIAENVQRQLEKIVPFRGNALCAYCYGKNETRELPDNLIFPFGINANQLMAVTNAFSSQVSVIEGPPGTGKTQTILNIVANILLKNQKVAIVSNNNEAVVNVYEKLGKVNLDYLVAELGSVVNKNNFFSNAREIPNKPKGPEIEIKTIQENFDKLKKYLQLRNKLAQFSAEIKEFKTERHYLEEWRKEHPSVKMINVQKYRLNPKKMTDLMVYMKYLTNRHVSLVDRFRLILNFRVFKTPFLDDLSEQMNFIFSLQFAYYNQQIENRQNKIKELEKTLENAEFDHTLDALKEDSLVYLKQHLAKNIKDEKISFTANNYRNKKNFNAFLNRFPIVGSSTHSIINSVCEGFSFDYIIIDEASQQDIVPGILSLGCAKNIIIVGDRKQLPHIPEKSNLKCPSEYYDCTKYSLLDSVIKVFENEIPMSLLKEHYRCHPKIIQFCNQQFYDNQLIPMSEDNGEQAIEIITTSKGNHTRNYSNLRELESIIEVRRSEEKNVGVIAPYRNQVALAEKTLSPNFIKKTVHKSQGREYQEVIFSTVLDKKGSYKGSRQFVDQSPLVNVAVSRAIKRFTLVTGDSVFDDESNIAALIRYIKYYAESDLIHESPVISAFDLLYDDYDKSLEKLSARLSKSNAEYKSERIVDILLKDLLAQEEYQSLEHHKQIYLTQLVSIENNSFTQRELEFINQKSSCDFVLYYKVGKTPLCVIEVDGGSHEKEVQKERDSQKNSILEKSGIPLLRLKTIEGNIELKLHKFIDTCLSKD
ncbi:hypothetical protein IGI66_002903 [Enterococcus sp. AZ048]|uniref:AAA domain-containing protein n=1 Tax=Enterococcus sp. AZ048 TaxID=2774658 RepID=UPI003F20812D